MKARVVCLMCALRASFGRTGKKRKDGGRRIGPYHRPETPSSIGVGKNKNAVG